jgi:hypothetical protein
VNYVVANASSVTITGTITKYYCSGKKSGSFDFSATRYWEGGFLSLTRVRAGGPYQFLFQNDADYLMVESRIRLEFPDGSVFRPRESTSQVFYFKDIKLDVNDMAYFLDFVFKNTDYQKVSL